MRVYGRVWGVISSAAGLPITDAQGNPILPSGLAPGAQSPVGTPTPIWVTVQTDSNGNNDLVYFTALCQALLLNLEESPFYAQYGIPALQSVQQQVAPTYYVSFIQQAYAPYFSFLQIAKVASATPTYNVRAITHAGVVLNANIPIPY